MKHYFKLKLILQLPVSVLMIFFIVTVCTGNEEKGSSFGKSYQKINPVTPLTMKTFANPPATDRPWVRWNFPSETANIHELENELQQMHESGIAGVEVGQGGEPTLEQIKAVLIKANKLGIKVSLKYRLGAPVKGTYSIANDYVRKTLTASSTMIAAGKIFNGVLPENSVIESEGIPNGPSGFMPTINEMPQKGTIVAVLAYRFTGNTAPDSGALELDRSSVIDLTSTLTGANKEGFLGGTTAGSISWTAPAEPKNAKWLLITIRAKAMIAQPEVFSLEGTHQLITGYEAYWTPEIKELLKINGGDIFIDSHDTDGFGAPSDLWGSNLAKEFKARMGYDLIPNLAVLFDISLDRLWGSSRGIETDHYYYFNDGSSKRILADFNQLRSDLFVENRITPFTKWAHTHNLTLRLQPEDGPTVNIPDQIQVANALERPEHETLAGGDQIDMYRPIASANHMNGNTWYSTEAAASRLMAYLQTFQDIIVRMNKSYIGGINKMVYHVYDYLDSPDTKWPGYNSMGRMFSGSWGNQNPNWFMHSRMLNDWLARNEQVLKQGVARVDVAVYMQNYSYPQPWGPGILNFRFWEDQTMQKAGFTWDYLNPTLLNLPNAKVTNNRLAEDGPSYKALILNTYLKPDSLYNSASNTLSINAAERILNYAKEGLPIIIIGEPSYRAPGFNSDKYLGELISELLKQKSVYKIANEAEVPGILTKLGIKPSAEPDQPSTLMSVHRFDKSTNTDYYFLYNQGIDQVKPRGKEDFRMEMGKTPLGVATSNLFEDPGTFKVKNTNPGSSTGETFDRMVALEGKGVPYLLNATSGKITPVPNYTSDGNHVTLRVKLARDESMMVGISEDSDHFGAVPPNVHVKNTTADAVVQTVEGSLAILSFQNGTYKTLLSNGNSISTTINNVPVPIDLTKVAWHLSVEDWQPTNPYGTTGVAGTETIKHPVELELNALKSWIDIPEFADASGIGAYTCTVNLPGSWNNAGNGAYINLGEVVDAFTLFVNDHEVPIDQISAVADIGPYLQAGANTIAVRVSTTLNNRLAKLDTDIAARGVVHRYGLLGPVVITPYKKEIVWSEK